MMDLLYQEKYQELTETIKNINIRCIREGQFVYSIFDLLTQIIHCEKFIFILPDDKGQFNNFQYINIDEKFINEFKDYYFQYDPYSSVDRQLGRKQVIDLNELISYEALKKSEYYNDFLLPQDIFHKVVCYISSHNKLYAVMALLRSQKCQNFNSTEIAHLNLIASYLGSIFYSIDLVRQIREKEDTIKVLGDHMLKGAILLDYSLKPLYINAKAEQILSSLGWIKKNHDNYQISNKVLEDCLTIKNEINLTNPLVIHEYSHIDVLNDVPYKIYSQLICNNSLLSDKLFLITILECNNDVNLSDFKEFYGLTEKQVEILAKVYKGMTNPEIAYSLFTTEINVKKHLQNIFDKVGVKSRVELIHKIVEMPHV